ncbi:MAG: hypothetical protein QG637_1069, partial [Chloroflexota bacterium]|nr:hypothetical protein [Chloroflexota bacterium]
MRRVCAGLFGWNFALAFFIASIALGLFGGAAAHVLEARGWLAHQARFPPIAGASGLTIPAGAIQSGPRVSWGQLLKEIYTAGRRLALFFFNTEASLPLARALLKAGMSHGAVLAFLITGAGTSIGAVTGALTIARWRVVGLVIATL